DTETAELPAAQTQLIHAIEATGTPTVLVILAGRPVMIGDVLPTTRALLMAYLPGTEGGPAVADVLFGAYNPSGKLPVSWPRRIGDAPLFYTYLPGHNDAPGSGYDPLFAFGDGLGYTTFTYGQLQVMAPPARDGTLRVAVDVTNTGRRAGDEIVQVY